MSYFTPDYLEFFKELAANNHKEWFDANRKRYEEVVRDPFKHFIGIFIEQLRIEEPDLLIEPKDAIFRINRDIRFAKDKTPYKVNNSALISVKGRKDKNCPGVYVEFGPEKLGFYGGIYAPDTKQVQKVRSFIASNHKSFVTVLNDKEFSKNFSEIQGEKSKRIPKEFKEIGEKEPLIWNKQWYYYKHMSPELITGDQLLSELLRLEKIARPVKDFLTQAIQ